MEISQGVSNGNKAEYIGKKPLKEYESKFLPESLLKDINYADDSEDEEEEGEQCILRIIPQKKTSASTMVTNHTNFSSNPRKLSGNISHMNSQNNSNTNSFPGFDNPVNNLNRELQDLDLNMISGNSWFNQPQRQKTYSHNNINEIIVPGRGMAGMNCNLENGYPQLHNLPNQGYINQNNNSNYYNGGFTGNISKLNENPQIMLNSMPNHPVKSDNRLFYSNYASNNSTFENMLSPNMKMRTRMNMNNSNINSNCSHTTNFPQDYSQNMGNYENMSFLSQNYKYPLNRGLGNNFRQGGVNCNLNNRLSNSNSNLSLLGRCFNQNLNNSNNSPSMSISPVMNKKHYSGNVRHTTMPFMQSPNSTFSFDDLIEEYGDDFEKFVEKIDAQLIPFIKTQKGSRFMQKFLNKISPESVDRMLNRLSSSFKEIMVDNYGNYFMQKLMQSCSSEQRVYVVQSIYKDFLEIANNSSGTHSIQSLIEIINMSEEEEILKKCIEPHILKLACNSNGTHIIQKIISCFEEKNREFLNTFVVQNLNKMCMNANGICVVKKFINANKDKDLRDMLLNSFEKDFIEIVEDAFGNYAVQHIIDVYGADTVNTLINQIIQNIVSLSNQKFSSNVVEKCIQTVNQDVFKSVVNEMFFNVSNFVLILKNKYGNFVIQKAIARMSQNEKEEMKEYLIKKVSVNGGKERTKFNAILELL